MKNMERLPNKSVIVVVQQDTNNRPTMIPRRSTPSLFESFVEGSPAIRRTVSKRFNNNDSAIFYESNKVTKSVKKKPSRVSSLKRHRNISLLQWSQSDVKGDSASAGSTHQILRELPKAVGVSKKLKKVTEPIETSKFENPRLELTSEVFDDGSVINVPFSGVKNKSAKGYALKCVYESNVSTEQILNEPVSRNINNNNNLRSIILKTKTRSTYSLKSKSRNLSLQRYELAKNYESCQAYGEKQLKLSHALAETSLAKLKSSSRHQVKQKYRRSSLNLKPFSLFSLSKNMSKVNRNISSNAHQKNLNTLKRQSNALKILENAVVSDHQDKSSICLSNYLKPVQNVFRDSEIRKMNFYSLINMPKNRSEVQTVTQGISHCQKPDYKRKQVCNINSFSLYKNGRSLYKIPQASSSDIKGIDTKRVSDTKYLTNYFREEEVKSNDLLLDLENSIIREKAKNNNTSYHKQLSRKRHLYDMKLELVKTNDSIRDFDNYCSNSKKLSKDLPNQISRMELKTLRQNNRCISYPLQNVISKLSAQNSNVISVSANSGIDERCTNMSKYIGRNNEMTSAYCRVYYNHSVGCNKFEPSLITTGSNATFYPIKDKSVISLPFIPCDSEASKISYANKVKSKISQVFNNFCNFFNGKKGKARLNNINYPNTYIDPESNIKVGTHKTIIQNREEVLKRAYKKQIDISRHEHEFSQYRNKEITSAYCQVYYDNGGKAVGCNKCTTRSTARKPRPHVINTFYPFEDGNFIVSPVEEESKTPCIDKAKNTMFKFCNIFGGQNSSGRTKNTNYSTYNAYNDEPKLNIKVDTDRMNVKNREEVLKTAKKKKRYTSPEEEFLQKKEEFNKSHKNKSHKKENQDKSPPEEEFSQNYEELTKSRKNKSRKKKNQDKSPPEEEFSQNNEELSKNPKKENQDETRLEEEFSQRTREELRHTKKTNKKRHTKNTDSKKKPKTNIESEINIKVGTDKMKIKNGKEVIKGIKKNKKNKTRPEEEILQNKQEELPQKGQGLFKRQVMTLAGEGFQKMLGSEPKRPRCATCLVDRTPLFIQGQPIHKNLQMMEDFKRRTRSKNGKNRCRCVCSSGDAPNVRTVRPKFDIEVDTDRMNIKNREEVLRSAMKTHQPEFGQINVQGRGGSSCCCSGSARKRDRCASCQNVPNTPILTPGQTKAKNMQNRQLLEIQMDSDSNILNRADVMDSINKMKGSPESDQSNIIYKALSYVDTKRLKREAGNTVVAKLVKYMITGRPVCVCQSDICSRDADLEFQKKEQALKQGKKVPCVCGAPSCQKLSTLRLMQENRLSKSEGRRMLKQIKKAQKMKQKKMKEERKAKMLKEQAKLKAKNMRQLQALGSMAVISKEAFSRLTKDQRAALKPIPTITKKEMKAFPKEQQATIKRQIKRQQRARKLAMQKENQMRKMEDKRVKQEEEDQAARELMEDERKARKQKQSIKEKLLAERLKRKNREQQEALAEKMKLAKEKKEKRRHEKKIKERIGRKMRKRKERVKLKLIAEKKKRQARKKKLKLKKKKAKMERVRKERKKFLKEMTQVTEAERKQQIKAQQDKVQQRLKRHAFMRKEIKKYKDAEDRYIAVETLKDVGKCCYKYTNQFLGFMSHTARHPQLTYKKLRRATLQPDEATKELQKQWSESQVHDIANRIEAKLLALDRLQPLGKRLYDKPKKKKIPKRRFKKRKRKRRAPVDFACSLYMGSLRNKPYFMVYWMCPWFYPHFISILKVLRQVADMGLFILAAFVWSPLIILWEVFRTIMCCGLCTA